MKKAFLTLLLIASAIFAKAQDKQRSDTLNIDLDKDLKKDFVIFDRDNAVIIVKLSTQKFKPIKSTQLEFDPFSAGIRPKREGFEFANNWMRAGYAFQFRYNPNQKKIQLIGMSRYEFGPANNDGSGESSINLLTNSYIGNWNYWDLNKDELIKIPAIKQKMIFPVTYFSNFDDGIFNQYQDKCVALYEKAKAKMMNKKN
ncbi:hypothetical protein [Pedobacter jamesrossensis]|uniref:DUF4468 domain-containing protein n=1 Tax=Pedobacter jamesrossensis TaxID=1908238 RepID=A0ABV8NHA2_9SPHI